MATEVVKFSPFWTQRFPGGSLILDRNLAAMAKALDNANATFIRVDASVTNIIDGTTPIALPATRIAFGSPLNQLTSDPLFTWDDTNNRLGIGYAAARAALDVDGEVWEKGPAADVRAFGADPTGIADSTTAVQAALDASTNVYFPEGTYVVSNVTVTTDGTRIFGDGPLSVLQMKFGATGVMISSTNQRLTIEGLDLDGGIASSMKGTSSPPANRSGIFLNLENDVRLLNLTVHGFGTDGIAHLGGGGTRSSNAVIANVTIYNCWLGLGLDGNGAEYVRLANLDIHHNYYGLSIKAGNTTASNCKINDNGFGVFLYGTGNANNGHGNLSDSLINHNTENIHCEDITIGFNFVGNCCFEGPISLKNCTGIHIEHGILDVTDYYFDGGGTNYIRNNYIQNGWPNTVHHNFNGHADSTLMIDNWITGGTFVDSNRNLFAAATVGTGQLTYGSGGGGGNQLTSSSTLTYVGGVFTVGSATGMQFNETTNTLSIGIASPAVTAAHIKRSDGTNGVNLYIQNPNTGTGLGNYAGLTIGESDALFGTGYFGFWRYGSTVTPGSGFLVAGTAQFQLHGGTGHILYDLNQASGDHIFATGTGITERMRIANGGNVSIAYLTAGSVVYAAASGVLSQDNAGLFYTPTDRTLAIGTNTTTAGQKLKIAGDTSIASGAGVTWDVVRVDGGTLTLTGSTTVDSLRVARFSTSTITDGSAVTVTKAATVSIAGPPAAGGSVTISTALALDIESGDWAHHQATGTNWSRVRAFFSGGIWNLKSEKNGSGTLPSITVDAGAATVTAAGALAYLYGSTQTEIGLAGTTPYMTIYNPGAGFSFHFRLDVGTNVASSASLQWDGFNVWPSTLTLSGSTNVTTATGLNATTFSRSTITSGSALTVTHAATVKIEGDMIAGGSTTITNKYSLWVAGLVRTDGGVNPGGGAAATLGTIGGASPTTAAQFKWIPWNVDGQAGFIPFWK